MCLNEKEFDYETNYDFDDLKTKVLIESDKVVMENKFPVSVSVSQDTSSFKYFNTEVFTEYLNYYLLAINLTDEQTKHLDDFCISCAEIYASSYGFEAQTSEFAKGDYYIIIYYLGDPIENQDPVNLFSFAHKFYVGEP